MALGLRFEIVKTCTILSSLCFLLVVRDVSSQVFLPPCLLSSFSEMIVTDSSTSGTASFCELLGYCVITAIEKQRIHGPSSFHAFLQRAKATVNRELIFAEERIADT